MIVGLSAFRFLGSEFLPQLNEGSIWLRVQLPYSASLNESVEVSKKIRRILMDFPQVKYAVSQTGRPDDGTDVAGFYNNE
ncbi:efflux RND transporter permease subunit, partial [Acinetobacter baumannii]